MNLNSFRELFLFLLSDIYEVENKLLVEIPRLVKKAHSEKLREALQAHLTETKTQVKRLEKVFSLMGEKPIAVDWSKDIKNIFSDMDKFFQGKSSSPLLDAAIIAVTQRVEHFEIATYGTLKEFADVLENSEVKKIMHESLKEECEADTMLTKLAQGGIFRAGINTEAVHKL